MRAAMCGMMADGGLAPGEVANARQKLESPTCQPGDVSPTQLPAHTQHGTQLCGLSRPTCAHLRLRRILRVGRLRVFLQTAASGEAYGKESEAQVAQPMWRRDGRRRAVRHAAAHRAMNRRVSTPRPVRMPHGTEARHPGTTQRAVA